MYHFFKICWLLVHEMAIFLCGTADVLAQTAQSVKQFFVFRQLMLFMMLSLLKENAEGELLLITTISF